MELNLDCLEVVASHCNRETFLNMCLASRELWKLKTEELRNIEFVHFSTALMQFIKDCIESVGHAQRLKAIHRMFRKMLNYRHILCTSRGKEIIDVLHRKLDEFVCDGMSKRKYASYKKQLRVINEFHLRTDI